MTDLSVGSAKFIIPLAIVISLGICNIDGVSLSEEGVFAQALDALGTAIDAGTMSALQILYIWGALKKCKALLRGFCRGASPHLHTLYVPFVCFLEPSGSGVNDGEDDDEDRRDWEQTEENVGALAVTKKSGVLRRAEGVAIRSLRMSLCGHQDAVFVHHFLHP